MDIKLYSKIVKIIIRFLIVVVIIGTIMGVFFIKKENSHVVNILFTYTLIVPSIIVLILTIGLLFVKTNKNDK